MKCSYHSERESVDKCTDCGKQICSVCLTTTAFNIKASHLAIPLTDRHYCPSCIDRLIASNIEKPQKPITSEQTTSTQLKSNTEELQAKQRQWEASIEQQPVSAPTPISSATVKAKKPIPARNTSKYSGQYSGAFDYNRVIKIFMDSGRIAVSSKNPDTAKDRFALAVEAYHQILSMKVPVDVRESVQKCMEDLADVFPTQVVLSEALGLREKARKLKTPKKQLEFLHCAQDVIDRGLAANPGSVVLQTAAKELRVEISQLEAAAR